MEHDKLKQIFRNVFSVLTKKTKVWESKFKENKQELIYEYKYDGFVFLVTVYRNVREDGTQLRCL